MKRLVIFLAVTIAVTSCNKVHVTNDSKSPVPVTIITEPTAPPEAVAPIGSKRAYSVAKQLGGQTSYTIIPHPGWDLFIEHMKVTYRPTAGGGNPNLVMKIQGVEFQTMMGGGPFATASFNDKISVRSTDKITFDISGGFYNNFFVSGYEIKVQ